MESTSRPRHTRTRAGCLTCRTRKKKCDQLKPRCAGCRRNQLACDWPCGVSYDVPEVGNPVVRLRSPMHTAATQPRANLPPIIQAAYSATQRACGLTPQSVAILEHYVGQTASYFAMEPLEKNPFLTILLPLAYVDDLLMHGLLALSGAHLTYKEPGRAGLASATRMHYARLISGLRSEFTNLREGDLERMERLLRVLMVACHYEAISGDTQGAMFNHLRAGHHLITSLAAFRNVRQSWHGVNIGALGFSLEVYAYLVLCNTIIPYGIVPESLSPLDAFVISLEEMSSFPTFGALFADSHELFRLIAEVSLLASHRLAEEIAGSAQPTASLKSTYDDIKSRIESWKMREPYLGESLVDWEHKRNASETFRQGLHIYLATALAGSTVSATATREAIQDHVDKLFSHAIQTLTSKYHFATMLWPIVVAGTCIVEPLHQRMFIYEMRSTWNRMKHLEIIGNLLQLLWDDPDPRAFGPYGLYWVMRKHGQIIGLA